MNRFGYIAASLMALAGALRADTVYISSGGGNPVPFTEVKIVKIDAGKLVFRTATGNETSRDVKQVTKMVLDDEPSFNAAEDAFAAGEWDKATDAYQKTIKSTNKPWLADFCTLRLIDSASKSGRFDAAVTGYIAAVLKDPAMADAKKPTLPDAKSTYLDTAAQEINRALADTKLQSVQRQALLSFLLEIQRTRGDTKAAAETMEKLLKISADAGGDPLAGRALADLKLGMAHMALDEKNYAKVIETINASSAVFLEPDQQADALYCLAEAKYGLASARKDETSLKEAALAYMRVVAHFKDQPGAPFVAESLIEAATILEQLNQTSDAVSIYEQITVQYPDSPVAGQAKASLERINSGS
jgi:tetratricopeptide (TPR) repeat protein